MLYSSEHVRVTIDWLRSLDEPPPLVIDPVMIATSGDSLLKDGALDVYTQELLPLASLITPNLDEAAALSDSHIGSLRELEEVAIALAKKFSTSVLAKGGHLQSSRAVDVLATSDGQTQRFEAPLRRWRQHARDRLHLLGSDSRQPRVRA